jgi:hypothetical protein
MPFSLLKSRPLLAREDEIRKRLSLEPFHHLSTRSFIPRVKGMRSQKAPRAFWIFAGEVACHVTIGFYLETGITRRHCSGIGNDGAMAQMFEASRGEHDTKSRRICLEKLGRSWLAFQREAKVHEALLRHLFRL